MESPLFKIKYLDHVAIRVRDIAAAIKWYERTLGLKAFHSEEWGPWPVLMLAGKTGIALFPAKEKTDTFSYESTAVYIDHFAFKISEKDFESAKRHLDSQNISFDWQDHVYFQSLHFRDLDGHKLELTCPVNSKHPPY